MHIQHSDLILTSDAGRVLLRPFMPPNKHRLRRIVHYLLELPEERVSEMLKDIFQHFEDRHIGLEAEFIERFRAVEHSLPSQTIVSRDRQLLIGAHFTCEYAIESCALFNPSMVEHPDQSGLEPEEFRYVLSLRATGEGHYSSITFKTLVLGADGQLRIEAPSRHVVSPTPKPGLVKNLKTFSKMLQGLAIEDPIVNATLSQLPETFSFEELRECLDYALQYRINISGPHHDVGRWLMALAKSNYEVAFDAKVPLNARVLFPSTPAAAHGLEDLRLVRFVEDDRTVKYFGTFTAYSGAGRIWPQLLETTDFAHFRIWVMSGSQTHNKGMALFPRRIDRRFAMVGRQDGESMFLMRSDDLLFWDNKQPIIGPKNAWEITQIGNCGSPIETKEGWILLTHGVGPMRKYVISAILLDLDDPRKVVKRLEDPLLQTGPDERNGYVPNVVYSCGGAVHGDRLVIPYAIADSFTRFASVKVDELLAAMK